MVCGKCGRNQHGTGTAHGTVCVEEFGEDYCVRKVYGRTKKV